MKFNIGEEVYILKRHVKRSVIYYEILPDIIKDCKVITIIIYTFLPYTKDTL